MAPGTLTLQILDDNADNRRRVNVVLQAATDYHLLVEGRPPDESHVEEFFTAVPPGYTLADMAPLGFFIGDEMIGAGGVLRGWNAPDKCMIGLLVFSPEWRRGGHGRAALALVESLVAAWGACRTLRVGVVENNADALAFWRRVGFFDTGEIKPGYGPFAGNIVILEKSLSNHSSPT